MKQSQNKITKIILLAYLFTCTLSAWEAILNYTSYPEGRYQSSNYLPFASDSDHILGGGDSILVWFRPGAECDLLQLHIPIGYSSEWAGQMVDVKIYSIKENWIDSLGGDGSYDFGQFNYTAGANSPHDSLLLETGLPVVHLGYGNMNTIDIKYWNQGNPLSLGQKDFAVVIGLPERFSYYDAAFYWDASWYPFDSPNDFHSFYYNPIIGWRSGLNYVIMATVDYKADHPPVIKRLTLNPGFVETMGAGLYEFSAQIYDKDSFDQGGMITKVKFDYEVNGVADSIIFAVQDLMADSIYTCRVELKSAGSIRYRWLAWDNRSALNPWEPDQQSSTRWLSFDVHANDIIPDSTASILVVDDNAFGFAKQHILPLLDKGGWSYDYWNVYGTVGLTLGGVSQYSTIIWEQTDIRVPYEYYDGSRGGSYRLELKPGLPVILSSLVVDSLDVKLLQPFIDSGGSLLLTSSDYIGSVEDNFDGVWRVATAGSFLETYLHVEEYVSDANAGYGWWPAPHGSTDTLYQISDNTGIMGDLNGVQFIVDTDGEHLNRFPDEVYSSTTDYNLFKVYSYGEELVEAGIFYEPGANEDRGYSLFLPWQFSAIRDSTIALKIMNNILKAFGTPKAVGIHAPPDQAPFAFYLHQNYPNPFNPITTIQYSLPEAGSVNITVFDIQGREVTTLLNTAKPPGNYELQWNGMDQSGHAVSTGVYFARLEAGDYSKTIKMVYLR